MAHSRIEVSVEKSKQATTCVHQILMRTCYMMIDYFDYCVDTSNRADDLKWLEQLEMVGFALDGDAIIVSNDHSFLDKWRNEAVKAVTSLICTNETYRQAFILLVLHL